MLRKLRILLACIFFLGITFLFLDFTGSIHAYLGWMAKVQFIPAILSLNFIIVAVLLILTLIGGRLYCSIVCPLGIMQDIFASIGRKVKRNRYSYSPAKQWLRISILAIFIISMIAGVGVIPAILAPYSSYGRIVSSLFAPIYYWGNNLLALGAEKINSYLFYSTDIWFKGIGTLSISLITIILLAILAWRNGRTYCNTICPVGTILGFVSRFSLFAPQIDTRKCNGCTRCARNCKAACINPQQHSIDYSRCVVCMDCIDNCTQKAISYRLRCAKHSDNTPTSNDNNIDKSRRGFIAISALLATTPLANAKKKGDGGLAIIEEKKIPKRSTRIVPPGAISIRNMEQHCTACQLCVSACPNGVLRPSQDIMTLMQPEASYERGYCRPECVKCSSVCPTGAIKPITIEDKSATQIGHAVWIKENCLAARGVRCDNCFRHCPTGAIQMIEQTDNGKQRKIPTIDTERCIGCGACENLCPARPLSGIYVEGHRNHRTI